MRGAIAVLIFLAALGSAQEPAAAKSQQSIPVVFPMVKGTSWTYRAHVKWAKGETDLRWTVTVTDTLEAGDVSAALLRGGPWDLAWYQPNVRPGTHAIIRVGDTYYLLHDDGRDTFAALKAGEIRDLANRLSGDIWFRVPMRQDDTFCPPESSGQPPMYCWSVDSVARAQPLKIGKVSLPAAETYQLTFRSNPDTEVVTLVPGFGITNWEYVHRGSVAEARLHLIEYRAGK